MEDFGIFCKKLFDAFPLSGDNSPNVSGNAIASAPCRRGTFGTAVGVFTPRQGDAPHGIGTKSPRRQYQRALNDVLQLADIARPGIVDEPVHRFGIDTIDTATDPRGEVISEGPYGEAAEALIVVDVELRQPRAAGTKIAEDLAARGYTGP